MKTYIVNELNDLKKIPLDEFLKNEFDMQEKKGSTTRKTPVLEYKDGSGAFIITKQYNNDYVFFSKTDDIGGTAIDFLLKIKGMTMPEIYQQYVGGKKLTYSEVNNVQEKLQQSPTINKTKYKKYRAINKHHHVTMRDFHLSEENYLPLSDNGFIRKSSFSLVFPFYQYSKEDTLELSGIYHHKIGDRVNLQTKLFEKGSAPTLGIMTENINNPYVFICEQPIDALSHREMMLQKGRDVSNVTYIHTGGSFGKTFEKNLIQFIHKKKVSTVFIGFDNDCDGNKMRQGIANILSSNDVEKHICVPRHKDWQEDYLFEVIEAKANETGQNRLSYVRSLNWNKRDEKLLLKTALVDERTAIKTAALIRVNDPAIITKALKHETCKSVLTIGEEICSMSTMKTEKIRDTYIEIEKCEDFKHLQMIALNDPDNVARLLAIQNIDDDKTLTQVAISEKEERIAKIAIDKINNTSYMMSIMQHTPNNATKEYAKKKRDKNIEVEQEF